MQSKQVPTKPRIVILGGGTGGTLTANRLRKALPGATITVVDANDRHVYQPGLLFVPFGLADTERHRPTSIRPAASRHRRTTSPASTTSTSTAKQVHLEDGNVLGYDVLVVATGCAPGARGDRGPDRAGLDGARSSPSTTSRGRPRWPPALATFDGGRLVVNVVDMPIKCPVAPLEFCFLADWYFHERGHPRPGGAHLRHAARRRLHQADGLGHAGRHARRAGHRAGHRVQHRRGRRCRRAG